ncbi:S9 family peptidase [Halobium salinum]|uniref:S9 family peptidase n=1 Tax=Halobium salinum TaxID=1364940 RepID=A0ABD5PGW0_9EURY|nr:S9 family peptidase [Halobium salinum]
MEPVRAADFHELAAPSDPQLSPDGDRVAFVRSVPKDDESYESTVYVVPTGGDGDGENEDGDRDAKPRQFTASEGVDSQPRFSPSGDRLAFVSTRGADDDRPQLWVLPTDGGEARRVTNVPGGIVGPVWSPDGSRIAFCQATTADERESGVDCDVTVGVEAGEESEPYERETPDPRVIDRLMYRGLARYKDGTRSHVYVVDLDGDDGTGDGEAGDRSGDDAAAVTRVTDGDHDFTSVDWGDASTLFWGVRYPVDTDDGTVDADDHVTNRVERHDFDAGATETVTGFTAWGPVLAAASDGRVAVLRTPAEGLSMRQTEVDVYDPETGETTTVTEDLDRTVDATCSFRWGPDEECLYFVTPDEGEHVIRRAWADGSGVETTGARCEHEQGFDVVAVGGGAGDDGEHEATGGDGDDHLVATVHTGWNHPGDVFCASVPTGGDGEETRLTELDADYFETRAVAEPESVAFESDGHEIQGWLLTPHDESDHEAPYPLAVEIHGGPHYMWSAAGSMWHEFQTLAARGYAVFWSNPRGSTGYGEAFATAIERDWGEVTTQDVLAGVDTVCERDDVDETNQFVTGGSFGGFMTGWLVGHTDQFDGAVAQRGVYDLASFYGSTDAFKLVEWDFGTTPWEEPEFLWSQSPVAYADEVTTPTLVLHADDDFRVPVNNGEMFYVFLKKNGVDTRLVRYPREGHELSRSGEPAHRVDRIERIVRWFDGYSDHHDDPHALDRGGEGLSAGDDAR